MKGCCFTGFLVKACTINTLSERGQRGWVLDLWACAASADIHSLLAPLQLLQNACAASYANALSIQLITASSMPTH